jgi:hypothetical protein
VKIRMLRTVLGSFHNRLEGAKYGEVVDIDEDNARRYIHVGMAEAVPEPPEERAVPDPDQSVQTAVPARKVGRPRRAPEWHDDDAPGFKPVEQQ